MPTIVKSDTAASPAAGSLVVRAFKLMVELTSGILPAVPVTRAASGRVGGPDMLPDGAVVVVVLGLVVVLSLMVELASDVLPAAAVTRAASGMVAGPDMMPDGAVVVAALGFVVVL